MGLSIRNAETVAKARRLAALQGLGITKAIDDALDLAIAEHEAKASPKLTARQATERLWASLERYPKAGPEADKAFFDDMWGQ